MLKIKIWASFERIIELFTQTFVTKLSKIWVWDPESGIRDSGSGIQDPGSEIRDPEKTYSGSGSRGQKGTGSRIRIRTTGREYWMIYRGRIIYRDEWFIEDQSYEDPPAPTTPPPFSSANCLSFSVFLCVAGRGRWGWEGVSEKSNQNDCAKAWSSLNQSILSRTKERMNKKRGRKRGFPEHILRVVVPMAGGLPELGVVDVGRNHLLHSGPRRALF